MYNLGYAKLMLNKKDDALKMFQKAVEIDPESQQAKDAIDALTAPAHPVTTHTDGTNLSEAELREIAKAGNDPAERAKVIIAPQRPGYLRRKSMESIVVGTVFELTKNFTKLNADLEEQRKKMEPRKTGVKKSS